MPSSPHCPAPARTAPPPPSPPLSQGWPGSRGRGNPGPVGERTVRCGAGRESSTCSSAMAATSCGTEAEMLGSLIMLQYRQSAEQGQLQSPPGAGRPGLLPQPGQVVLHLLQGGGVQHRGDRRSGQTWAGGRHSGQAARIRPAREMSRSEMLTPRGLQNLRNTGSREWVASIGASSVIVYTTSAILSVTILSLVTKHSI